MKRLLIVFTGGTIGSKAEGSAIDVESAGSYALLEAYGGLADARRDVAFDTLQPLNLLSENMTPADWVALASAIRATDWSLYDGIIVTHGSDTLAYTSAMLGYLFSDITIPLVLTASNYPIADARSNGLRNLSGSVDFIAGAALPGVFALYENSAGEKLVYLGTRIMQNESFTDQFRAPYDLPFGSVEGQAFRWRDDPRNPRPEKLSPVQRLRWEPDTLRLEDAVMYIKPYQGLNYRLYDWQGAKPKAILHDLHHSGTACALEEGPYSLPAFIARCRQEGIDVYLCPIKDRSAALYASSHKLTEAGAIWIENMCIEAALTKLMLAYGMMEDRRSAQRFVTEEIVFHEKLPVGS